MFYCLEYHKALKQDCLFGHFHTNGKKKNVKQIRKKLPISNLVGS